MFGNRFSSSTSCSRWLHETEPGRLDPSFSGRFLKIATHPYQAFASVGEDDPSGDEKTLALTRQCRVILIVATQSISSPPVRAGQFRGVAGLLQTLRTRIVLSLSDEASAESASKLCGQVRKLKATYAINETSRQSGINSLSAQAGGGHVYRTRFLGHTFALRGRA